jgi:NAD(P)-dependent dehydrogenase (short-subunit alcohol dehydrogenase family)
MRFDGRVAIVTGAGGNPGLGRSHAMLLASRGAKVVVNDLGVGSDGSGAVPHRAQDTVDEIVAAGGEAVADTHSVATEESAREVVQTALDTWGRLDILVNNAGVAVVAGFHEITTGDLEILMNVHLMGDIWMCRAAWPHMREAGYGRIVSTTSGAMHGSTGMSIYAAAKYGIYGLTRGLAVEGFEFGIKANSLSPGGYTNSLDPFFSFESEEIRETFIKAIPAELVSPGIAYLAHEDCAVTGTNFDVGGGQVTAMGVTSSGGFFSPELTMEDVRDNLTQILDQASGKAVEDPFDPIGTEAEASKLLIRRPYEPRF